MKRRTSSLLGALAGFALLLAPSPAAALDGGMWDYARPESGSCGWCHGPGDVLPGGAHPVLLMPLEGIPDSYVPGATYRLTLQVIGPVVPIAGFNLEATGGNLKAVIPAAPDGGTARIGRAFDECEALEDRQLCQVCDGDDPECVPVACEVLVSDECPMYGPEYPGCACPEEGADFCRACDPNKIVSIQATHAHPATVPEWTVDWTAPPCGFGTVKFYAAGNSTNGAFMNDPADIWGVLPEPILAMEDDSGCAAAAH